MTGDFDRRDGGCVTSQSKQRLEIGPVDPLDPDMLTDTRLSITDRQLARLVVVAVETGGRFAREGRDEDPTEWMYSPLYLFDGTAPVEACVSRKGFIAALVLHGIWPEVDADPIVITEIFETGGEVGPFRERNLYTAVLEIETPVGVRRAFYATVAADAHEVRTRLLSRVGHTAAEMVEVLDGFDALDGRAQALLPDAMYDYLSHLTEAVELLPTGFELLVDYRLAT